MSPLYYFSITSKSFPSSIPVGFYKQHLHLFSRTVITPHVSIIPPRPSSQHIPPLSHIYSSCLKISGHTVLSSSRFLICMRSPRSTALISGVTGSMVFLIPPSVVSKPDSQKCTQWPHPSRRAASIFVTRARESLKRTAINPTTYSYHPRSSTSKGRICLLSPMPAEQI